MQSFRNWFSALSRNGKIGVGCGALIVVCVCASVGVAALGAGGSTTTTLRSHVTQGVTQAVRATNTPKAKATATANVNAGLTQYVQVVQTGITTFTTDATAIGTDCGASDF